MFRIAMELIITFRILTDICRPLGGRMKIVDATPNETESVKNMDMICIAMDMTP